MPVRSRRFFRAQFQLLVALNLLESAEEQLEAAEQAGHQLRARRARRRVDRLRRGIEARRSEALDWLPRNVREQELLARVRPMLGADTPALTFGPPRFELPARLAIWALTLASAVGWGVTAGEIARHGIGDRPELIVAEAVAILVSPFAIALFGRRRL